MTHQTDPGQALVAPPHSIEAEHAVLGAILAGGDARSLDLRSADLYSAEHRAIYSAVESLIERDEAADAVTVAEEMIRSGSDSVLPDLQYLSILAERSRGGANIDHYARIVRERSSLRQLLAANARIADLALDGGGRTPHAIHEEARRQLEASAERLDPAWAIRPISGRKKIVDWYWRGWLPRAKVTLVAAEGGTGKGTLIAHVTACAHGRKPWPCGQTTEPTGVLIISPDDHEEDTLWPRLEASGARRDLCWVQSARRAGQPVDWSALHQAVRDSRGGIGLVVIDMLQAGLRGGDSGNSPSAVAEHIARFTALAEESGVGVVVVHHTNKRTASRLREGNLRDLVRGSGAWTDSVRMAWLLVRDETDQEHHTRILGRVKCNLPISDWSVGGYRVYGGEREYTADDGRTGQIVIVERLDYMEERIFDAVATASRAETGGTVAASRDGSKIQAVEAEILDILSAGGPMLSSAVRELVERELGEGGDSQTYTRAAARLDRSGAIIRRRPRKGEFPGAPPAAKVMERPGRKPAASDDARTQRM